MVTRSVYLSCHFRYTLGDCSIAGEIMLDFHCSVQLAFDQANICLVILICPCLYKIIATGPRCSRAFRNNRIAMCFMNLLSFHFRNLKKLECRCHFMLGNSLGANGLSISASKSRRQGLSTLVLIFFQSRTSRLLRLGVCTKSFEIIFSPQGAEGW